MKPYFALLALLMLMACTSTPVPRVYVLSTPADAVAGVQNATGRPVIELPTVTLPDYLDSADILVRDGRNELKPSTTGRWGERLSVGITHALEIALGRRLPGVLVTHTPVTGEAGRQLLVDISAFEFRQDGRCVLTARWTVPGSDNQPATISERGTFVTNVAPGDAKSDAAVVSAMTAAVDQLAIRIAGSLRPGAVAKPARQKR